MESNTEEKPLTNLQNQYEKGSKEVKSDYFCYCIKVKRAITKWGSPKEISHFEAPIIFSPTID